MKSFMLRMRDRRARMKGGKEFKQAAFTYMGLKILLLMLTYLFMTCDVGCETSNITRPLIHLILGGHFIYAGMRITSSVLGVISFSRATAYLINFFFKKNLLLTLPLAGTKLTVLTEGGAGNWVFLVKALVMYTIGYMILRALKARFAKDQPEQMPAVTA